MVRVFEGSLGIFSVLAEGGLPVCVSVVKANSIPLFYTFSHLRGRYSSSLAALAAATALQLGKGLWADYSSQNCIQTFIFFRRVVVRPLSFL